MIKKLDVINIVEWRGRYKSRIIKIVFFLRRQLLLILSFNNFRLYSDLVLSILKHLLFYT